MRQKYKGGIFKEYISQQKDLFADIALCVHERKKVCEKIPFRISYFQKIIIYSSDINDCAETTCLNEGKCIDDVNANLVMKGKTAKPVSKCTNIGL